MKSLTCKVCDRTFTRTSKLLDHNLIHTGERPFECDICGKTFRQNGSFVRHKASVHSSKRPHKCKKCKKAYKSKQALEIHMVCHTGAKPYNCAECGKSFPYETSLRHHMLVHTGEKPYSCHICGISYTQVGTLRRHLPVHNNKGEKYEYCKDPLKSVTSISQNLSKLGKVQYSKKQDSDKKYRKSTKRSSGKVLGDLSSVKSEPQNHKKNRNIKDKRDNVHVFRKAWKGKYAKGSQMSVRNEAKSHSCKKCGKTYMTKADLLYHKQSHARKKLLKGRTTGRSDREVSSFQLQKQTSVRDRKLKCDTCGKTTFRLSNLKRHISRHIDERSIRNFTDDKMLIGTPILHEVEGKEKSTQPISNCKDIFTSDSSLNSNRYKSESNKSTSPQSYGAIKDTIDTNEHCCNICSSVFTEWADLDQHMQDHSWENAPSLSSMF